MIFQRRKDQPQASPTTGRAINTWHAVAVAIAVAFSASIARGQVLINEILFNPPGSDAPHEYIELRGTPNLVLPAGTHLVAVEGDAGGNPGTIQNVFDLSGRTIGGNGFLVLLQKGSSYWPNSNATVIVHAGNGPGWGDGPASSVGHGGEGGQTDIENPSITFLLLQSSTPPVIGTDIDTDNNGTPDGAVLANWTVLDSVGVLDADGTGDFGYGAINFRRKTSPGNGAGASGIIVPVAFTADYVGRSGNTVGAAAPAWVASNNLDGGAPDWTLGLTTNTEPPALAGAALDHPGAPNFGAAAVPGVLLQHTHGSTIVSKSGGTDAYTLALNTPPAGSVTIEITCEPQLEVSIDGGTTFGPTAALAFSNGAPKTVVVRAVNDHVPDVSPQQRFITHSVSTTGDPAQYPLTTLVPPVPASVVDNLLLLTELKVNPPGTNDAPHEFIELVGPPGAGLTNVHLIALDGNDNGNPGQISYALDLSGESLGPSGLLVIVATNQSYAIPPGTTVVIDPELNETGGALGNGTISFLLVSSAVVLSKGLDLDDGNSGVLDEWPGYATILDAVGWSDGDADDLVYEGVGLTQAFGTPDAATRFPGNTTPRSATGWFCGDLAGTIGVSLNYDPIQVSSNFPPDTVLTPGALNNTAPRFTGVGPISGVIGDPTNPTVTFSVSDAETIASAITVTATSSNSAVVPNANLLVTAGAGGSRTLSILPVGVGYSAITLFASDGTMTNNVTLAYAASEMGRPGGVWHLGASDGSTALALDAEFMLVGDDENQRIRLYRRRESALPVSEFNMTSFLELPDVEAGQVREVDIEASTRVGNRLLWMGSHSHANIGETRTNRTRIWATDLSGSGAATTLTYAGRYDYLKVDLIAWDKHNAHGKGSNYFGLEASDAEGVEPKAPDGSGFSIEGLALMPGSTNGAYVAFRAPIVPATNRTHALIVPVLNYVMLSSSDGPPGSTSFGAPIELDLYGRGIRSLEGSSDGFVIVAGPAAQAPGDYPQDFRLYTWTGQPGDQPQQRAADLSGLSPEGIAELPPGPWTPETELQLLSDNGQSLFYGDATVAKSLPEVNFKKSRSDLVSIGAVVKPAPVIVATTRDGADLTLTWRSLAGETYRVQTKTQLAQANWDNVPGDVPAVGPYASKVINNVGAQLFCRVLLVQPTVNRE